VQAVWPKAEAQPVVVVPAGVRALWPREEAVAYVVRGRMECIGPATVAAVARDLGLDPSDVEAAMLALESQGIVLRGRFAHQGPGPLAASASRGDGPIEWCERRLLARIHRLTLEGLRRQIAPVPPEQFIRFLLRHQHVAASSRLKGQAGLAALVEQMEGFAAPAGHWEKHLLSARLEGYSHGWLDGLTFFGQVAWGRLRPLAASAAKQAIGLNGHGAPMKSLTRSTPITLMLREHLPWLLPVADETNDAAIAALPMGSNARAAYEAFVRHGALFPAQLGTLLQLLPTQVDDVLGELAAYGLATSDGFPALRTLLGAKANKRARGSWRRRRGNPMTLVQPAGRWTLLRSQFMPTLSMEERTEQWCRLLLRRYGVMFRDLLANESAAPPWHELVRTYRRLEARGEIRGGRFVARVGGEQYALPGVTQALRSAADAADEQPVVLPATDPLNFTGRISGGTRVPALPGQFIAITGGQVMGHERPTEKAPSLGAFGS
jgi:ATP-dependent Lhr-like helicase